MPKLHRRRDEYQYHHEPEAGVLSVEASHDSIDSAVEMGNVVVRFGKRGHPVLLEILKGSRFVFGYTQDHTAALMYPGAYVMNWGRRDLAWPSVFCGILENYEENHFLCDYYRGLGHRRGGDRSGSLGE